MFRSDETQDQLPRPRARGKSKVVTTFSDKRERGAVSCIAWLDVSVILAQKLAPRLRDPRRCRLACYIIGSQTNHVGMSPNVMIHVRVYDDGSVGDGNER